MKETTDLSPRIVAPVLCDCVVLPGENEVDEALVESAACTINRIHTARGLATARAIGEYLLETFFGSDIEAFDAREKKHASFQALARRPDLCISASNLWYCVAVLEQLRQLPEDIGAALPVSHHRLLVHVRDPQAKVHLAREAVQEGLAKRDFAERVRIVKAREQRGTRRGRPPVPTFAKAITKVLAATDLAASEAVTVFSVLAYGSEGARARIADVDRAMRRLAALKSSLERGLAEAQAIGQSDLSPVPANGTSHVPAAPGQQGAGPHPTGPLDPERALEALARDEELAAFLKPHVRMPLGRLLPIAIRFSQLTDRAGLTIRQVAAGLDADYFKLARLARLTQLGEDIKAEVAAGQMPLSGLSLTAALGLLV